MERVKIRKKVLCPLKNEKTGKTYWMRIGNAFVNRDGSTNVYLDALPANGKLHIRDLDTDDVPSGEYLIANKDRPNDTIPF